MNSSESLQQTTCLHPALLLDILGQPPISFHRCYVQITNSVTAALWLSYAVYHVIEHGGEFASAEGTDGWFSKSQLQWEHETGLTRREQEAARKNLALLGLLQEKQPGLNQPLQFRIDMDLLMQLLDTQAQANSLGGMTPNAGPCPPAFGW